MFKLDQQAKILSIDTHSENNGEDRNAVYRMMMEVNCQSTELIEFSSTLRAHIFKKEENPDLAQKGSDDEFNSLRYPQIKSFRWAYESEGYSLTLGYGLGNKSDIKLTEVKIDKFTFTPQIGGTVGIRYRITYHPDIKDVGKIGELLMKDIAVKLIPPDPETLAQLFDKAA